MDRDNEFKKRINDLIESIDDNLQESIQLEERVDQVIEHIDNIEEYVNKFDIQFQNLTRLNKKDIAFLMLAVALQCVRQYFITPLKIDSRVDDKTAAKNSRLHKEEHSDRHHRLYRPSLDEIWTNPVPFDAIYGSKEYNLYFSGMSHRAKTLGHDPILGLVFGTANIATSTMTLYNLSSFHIKTGVTANGATRDKIISQANTMKIFEEVSDKLMNQGLDGKSIVMVSLLKEVIHLQSDINSKVGLPLPIIGTVLSPELSMKLSSYGLDFTNIVGVSKQIAGSLFINFIISLLHTLCMDESKDDPILYKMKTKKIIAYSNTIATTSNILYVAFTKDIEKLDIGGMIVTLHEIVSSVKMHNKLEEEFIANKWYENIMEV